eukprot:3431080-Prymnesium_polylepis.1
MLRAECSRREPAGSGAAAQLEHGASVEQSATTPIEVFDQRRSRLPHPHARQVASAGGGVG